MSPHSWAKRRDSLPDVAALHTGVVTVTLTAAARESVASSLRLFADRAGVGVCVCVCV